jgi:hypothetical protein
MNRRSFLTGLASTVVAPSIVNYASLMPMRGVIVPLSHGDLIWGAAVNLASDHFISPDLSKNGSWFRESTTGLWIHRAGLNDVGPKEMKSGLCDGWYIVDIASSYVVGNGVTRMA